MYKELRRVQGWETPLQMLHFRWDQPACRKTTRRRAPRLMRIDTKGHWSNRKSRMKDCNRRLAGTPETLPNDGDGRQNKLHSTRRFGEPELWRLTGSPHNQPVATTRRIVRPDLYLSLYAKTRRKESTHNTSLEQQLSHPPSLGDRPPLSSSSWPAQALDTLLRERSWRAEAAI